jgi:hypothetical protein
MAGNLRSKLKARSAKKESGSLNERFGYRGRSAEEMKSRENVSASNRDPFIKEGIKTFTPATRDNTIRIMPPTWEDASHYGWDVYVHSQIGPDRSAYMCPKSMKLGACPICEERQKAERSDPDYAATLRPSHRIAMYVIDRDEEDEGPKLWLAPHTLEKEIAAQALDKKTSEVFELDNLEEGFDLSFTREGKELGTKYGAVKIARRASPLSDDEDTAVAWMEQITDAPVPDQFIMHDEDKIAEAFAATEPESDEDRPKKKKSGKPELRKPGSKKAAEEEEEETTEEEDPPKKTKKGAKEEEPEDEAPDFTYDEVQAMDEDELLELAETLEITDKDVGKDDELADVICEKMGLEPPKKKGGDKKSSLRDRLAKFRK